MAWMVLQAAKVIGASPVLYATEAAEAGEPEGAPVEKVALILAKDTTVMTEPLHADGTPDYVKALNDRRSKGVTPENNAFVAWLKIVGTGERVLNPKVREQMLSICGAAPSEGMGPLHVYDVFKEDGSGLDDASTADEEVRVARQKLWSEQDFPLAARYLKEVGPQLDAAKDAFKRPRFWAPYVSSDGRTMMSVFPASMGRTQDVANALDARATLRARNGNMDGFISDVMAAKQISRHVGSGEMLIERMVGVAIDTQADSAVGAVAGAGILTAQQCSGLERAMDSLEPFLPMWQTMDVAKRWTLLDDALVVASGKAKLLGDLYAASVDEAGNLQGPPENMKVTAIDYKFVDWSQVLRRMNQAMDKDVAGLKAVQMEDVEKVNHERGEQRMVTMKALTEANGFVRNDKESREAYTERVAAGILAIVEPFADIAERRCRELAMQEAMVSAILAAAEYHAERNDWPGSLSDLVPAYLKEVPKDMYSPGGKGEVRYVATPEGVRVYSIGRNGVDDGGVRDLKSKRDDIVIGVPVK